MYDAGWWDIVNVDVRRVRSVYAQGHAEWGYAVLESCDRADEGSTFCFEAGDDLAGDGCAGHEIRGRVV